MWQSCFPDCELHSLNHFFVVCAFFHIFHFLSGSSVQCLNLSRPAVSASKGEQWNLELNSVGGSWKRERGKVKLTFV